MAGSWPIPLASETSPARSGSRWVSHDEDGVSSVLPPSFLGVVTCLYESAAAAYASFMDAAAAEREHSWASLLVIVMSHVTHPIA